MNSDPSASELSPIKRALIEIRSLRAQLDQMEEAHHEPIAIIGMGLRFPGDVHDADSFWRLLHDGVDAITEIPPERWSLEDYFDEDVSIPGKMTTRYGAFIKDIDLFDAAFFGISPREAISMDPQQRLLLETGWEALENAGQSTDKLLGSQTGVFIGISNSDYFRMLISDPLKIDTYASTGGTLSVAAGRISYLLGLQGPAVAIDTACSSSLVALHLACHSLRQKECNLALVGGVNLTLSPEANINFSKAGMMAFDGRCKTFDAQADGYVRGEGCAVIVIKRLSDAIADHDNILAVVRGTAINQDGRSSGLTAPNGPSQEAVIRAALRAAQVQPQQVEYVEAHGTGTSLGDPIEVHALGAVYGPGRDPAHPLLIGSVKTNIGHLEAAAGIAGVLKVALAMQHGEIPPHLHFSTPNPHIAWGDYPIAVPTGAMPWQPLAGRRLAGVSSFGFSGTNAHVILQEAPAPEPQPEVAHGPDATANGSPEEPTRALLFPFSARSENALRMVAQNYHRFLSTQALSAAQLHTLAHTISVGRAHYAHRLAITASSSAQLSEQLAAFGANKKTDAWKKGKQAGNTALPIVFLFTGHGSHYVHMGRQLYESVPVFRQVMDQCDRLLRPHLPVPLLSVLYPPTNSPAAAADSLHPAQADLNDMTYGQPAMFALEFALATMWRSWGIEPAAVAGHSLGEYAAAAFAGVLSLEDAVLLIAERGRLMQQLPENGLMVTVFANEQHVAPLVAPFAADVSIAAINSPETIVLSGRREAVLQVVENLTAQQIRTRPLNISRAAHSPMVEAMIHAIAETTSTLHFSPPEIEFFSSVTGEVISEAITHPEYWQRHLRQTVRFADAVQAMYAAGYRCFLEIGPHPTLINLGQRTMSGTDAVLWLPSLRENMPDWPLVLESMAQLYTNGAALDWDAVQGKIARQKFPLPTYPWEGKSYWWKTEPNQPPAGESASPTALPSWSSAAAAAQRQSQQAPLELELSTFSTKWDALNRLTTVSILNALQKLGAFSAPGQPFSVTLLLEKCAILPAYRHLMQRWLDHLVDSGWLQRTFPVNTTSETVYQCIQPVNAQPEDAVRIAAQDALADAPFVADYVIECGQHLSGVITGKESPLELMFPDGSMTRAEDLYQNWAHARYFNHIVGAVVEAVCQADPTRKLRMVEIGAGTGATTAAILPLLPPARVSYHFTDVSNLFLDRARQKFAAYPFVRYSLLDIEQDGLAQGYGRGQFDVVIAANVIHATRSLADTLQNVLNLLAPGGLLVLFEATTHHPWFDITTGLIEGWQSFDDLLRGDSPLLSASQWEAILREQGFADVQLYPAAGSPAAVLGETVLIARPHPQEDAASVRIDLDQQAQPDANGQPEPSEAAFLLQLAEALPDQRKEMLLDFVRAHVIAVLRMDQDASPDRKAPLMDIGVDSLMAVELRGSLTRGLKLERKLPATLIFDYPTIEEITDYLLRDVLVFASDEQPSDASIPSTTLPASSSDIENLSDSAVEAMLMEKLKNLK